MKALLLILLLAVPVIAQEQEEVWVYAMTDVDAGFSVWLSPVSQYKKYVWGKAIKLKNPYHRHYVKYKFELDCKKERIRMLETHIFDDKDVLQSAHAVTEAWFKIEHGSHSWKMLEGWCKNDSR